MTKRKSLSYLIEAELEKATVLLAAKAITDKLQQIAEQLAKMDANDVMPLGDSMRDLFGSEEASQFESTVSEKLRGLTEQVRNCKNEISDQIDALESGEPMNDLNQMGDDEMFPDTAGDETAEAPEGDEAFGGTDDFGGGEDAGHDDDNMDMDMGSLDDAFGGDTGGAAGRPTKESAEPRGRKKLDELSRKTVSNYSGKAIQNTHDDKNMSADKKAKRLKSVDVAHAKRDVASGRPLQGNKAPKVAATVNESADVRLVREFSALLRGGKSAGRAVHMIAESYAVDVATIVDIITKVKKG